MLFVFKKFQVKILLKHMTKQLKRGTLSSFCDQKITSNSKPLLRLTRQPSKMYFKIEVRKIEINYDSMDWMFCIVSF